MNVREGDEQEESSDNHPGEQEDTEGVTDGSGVVRVVRSEDARVGDEDGRVRHPEGAIRRESYTDSDER